jgi:nuclease HARBI1
MPNIVGAIDCTHVAIIQPTENAVQYMNRKGYYSVNVQAVCSANGLFIDVVARWPGSCHDAFIFGVSALPGICEAGQLGNGFLLGDRGYPDETYLLTPYILADTDQKELYNDMHALARVIIECTFGQVKRKFFCLHGELRVKPQYACRITVACMALHNFAKRYGFYDDDEDEIPSIPRDDDEHPAANDGRGAQARDLYAYRLAAGNQRVRRNQGARVNNYMLG